MLRSKIFPIPALIRTYGEVSKYASFIQPRIVTWGAFWSTIPFTILTAVIFIDPHLNNSHESLTWIAIALISHASMVPFVHYLNKRSTRGPHILMALFLGALKGVVLNLVAPILQVQDPLPILVRAANSAVVYLYLCASISIVQGIWGKFAKDLRLLIPSLTTSNYKSNFFSSATDTVIDDTERQNAIERLKNLLESSIEMQNDGLTLIEQAKAIDKVIHKSIRPNSSKRWKIAELVWPQIKPWEVLRSSLKETLSPVLVVFIIIMPLSIIGQLSHASILNATLLQLLSFVLIFLFCELADKISTYKKLSILLNNSLYIIFYLFIIGPILYFVNKFYNMSHYTSTRNLFLVNISAMLFFVAAVLFGDIVLTVYNSREKELEQLRKYLPEKQIANILRDSFAANENEEYAQYLHAEVQSQLTASKLLLLKAADSNFSSMSTETTRKVLARLELLEEPYQKKIVRNPKIRLTELADTWRGLTRIKMDLPTELNSFSPNGEVIAQLIEESVINAIRHGMAKNVRVNVTIENEICYIQIQDDGKLKSTRKPGLGSTFFQVFAPDWKLETNEVGTLATMSTPF